MMFTATGSAGKAARIARMICVPGALLAAGVTVCVILSTPARGSDAPATTLASAAESGSSEPGTGDAGAAPAASSKPLPHTTSPYHPASVPNRARTYYLSIWGVDNLLVRQTASGNLIRFSYRVVDPALAQTLADKRATPYMFGLRSHALLQIPVMDKVGELRQTGTLQAGKEYWMVFSNKGNFIRAGDRVNVIIGSAHVEGLLVE